MTTRTVVDTDGTWVEYLDDASRVFARAQVAESAAYTAAEATRRAALAAVRTAEQNRATQVATVLSQLDAHSVGANGIQDILAAVIRYVGQHLPRGQ